MKYFFLIVSTAVFTMLSGFGFCDMEKTEMMPVNEEISYSANGSSTDIRVNDTNAVYKTQSIKMAQMVLDQEG